MGCIAERTDKAFLSIIFKDHQEDIDAPFCVKHEDDFFIITGLQDTLAVEMIIPTTLECYFEIRGISQEL